MVTARRRTAHGDDEADMRVPADVPLADLGRMITRSLGWDGLVLEWVERGGVMCAPDASHPAAYDGAVLHFGHGGQVRAARAGNAPAPSIGGPPVHIAHDEIPGGELELAPPPSAPAPPRLAWPSMALPALFGVGSLVATLAQRTNGNAVMNAMTTGYMLLSAGVLLLNYQREKRSWSQQMQKRADAYGRYLARKREQLQAVAAQQLVLALDDDPDPQHLAQRTMNFRSIWRRTGGDALRARIGAARLPLQVRVKPPRYEPLLQPDPLSDAALALCAEVRTVAGMPLCVEVTSAPAIGLAGPRAALLGAARALLLSLAVQHTPEQVRIAAVFPREERAEWSWLRWLPHVWCDERDERLLACDPAGAARVIERTAASLDDRQRRGVHTLLVLADERVCADDARMRTLLSTERPALSVLRLAPSRDDLPRRCRTFVEYEGGRARLHSLRTSPCTIDRPDYAAADFCEAAARALASLPVEHSGGSAGIPALAPLLELWGARDVREIDAAANWRSAAHLDESSLRAPIGRGMGGALVHLDLRDGDRGHGAHGLVAGMTGAGKSELLQTLIASLAVRFHPDWLAFLLIDYKGGGMAGAFRGDGASGAAALPHLAGVMTNLLDAGAARRALIALDSELKRRQRIFEQNGVTYIDAYQKRYAQDVSGALAPMPRLVIIVDEFAELKRDQPEFMKQLISAARIGRSLGVHLILATQKPSGVVDEQIWSNSRFKLCLRVQDDGDSKEMLKRPDAARLQRAGRAFFMVGQDERFEEFQSAYGGAPYAPEVDSEAAARFAAPLQLDGRCDTARAVHAAPLVPAPVNAPSQLQALMRHLSTVADQLNVRPAERIWLEPLPPILAWDDVRLRADAAPGCALVGLIDEPRARRQTPLRVDFPRDGHLLIYGQTGSGKSALLLRLVTALARSHTPAELNVTVLDFGSRSLRPLEALPHVGDVLTEDDDEHVSRLFRALRREMTQRKALLDGRKFDEFRRSAPDAAPPLWLLVIDNYPAFARTEHDEALTTLVRDGAALGMHVALSANKPLDVRSRISGNIPAVLCLQQADRSDYATLVGRTNGLEPAALPGRGLTRTAAGPLEFQAALAAPGMSDAAIAASLIAEGNAMRAAWNGRPAFRVPTMPDVLHWTNLPPSAPDPGCLRPVIGMQTLDLDPLRLPLSEAPHVVITGAPASGKSTLLRVVAQALARDCACHIVLADPVGGEDGLLSLAGMPQVCAACADEAALGTALARIEAMLAGWRAAWTSERESERESERAMSQAEFAARQRPIVVLIDDADALARGLSRPIKERLDALLERGTRGWPVHFVLAGSDRGLDPIDGWVKRVKDAGSWVVLGGLQSVGYGLRLPASERDRPLPAGHGYFVSRRHPRPVRFRAAES